MAEKPFHTEITASAKQFNAEMDATAQKFITDAQRMQSAWRESTMQMGQGVGTAFRNMNTGFDAVKDTIGKVRGFLAGLGAVVLGGSFFAKFVNETATATGEVTKLARLLGVTTQEASALRLALNDIGSDTDTYVGALSKMTMKLREGEERFNQLGIKTRDANGNLLTGEQIMQNSLQVLLQFKGGTDRNLAASELFGKSWADVNRLMRLTPQAMEDARKKGEELQVIIGPLGAARALAYKRALNDLHDVKEALANRIGQALMPVLTDLANWLSSTGPAAVVAMRGAVGGLVSVFHGVANAVVLVWQLIKAFLFNVTEPMVGFGEAVGLALSGNFAAAGARLRQITPNVKAAWDNAWSEIVSSSEKTRDRLAALFIPDAEQGTGRVDPAGNRRYTPKQDGTRTSQWEAELAARRDVYDREQLMQGSFQEFSKQMESDFWKEILRRADLTKEERIAISRKYYAIERDIRKGAFELEIEDIKSRIEAHKAGSDERVKLAAESARRVGEKYGIESKEYRAAQADVEKYQREAADQRRKIEEMQLDSLRTYQMSRVELERAQIDTLETMGVISAGKKLAMLRELKEVEYKIELQAAEDRAKLLESDVIAHRQAVQRIAEIKQKHALEMEKQSKDEALQRKKDLSTWFDPIGDAIQRMTDGLLQGTQRFTDVMRNMMRNLLAQFITTLAKMAIEWIKTEILKTQATVAGTTARTAAEATASTTSKTSTIGTAITTIGGKAWEAAASVYASIAQIPYVGPFLAPVMAIAAAATVLGFIGKIASASGGFDIPAGVNPVTQLHSEEMVLPAELASRVRGMTDSGGVGGAIHIHAIDARSFQKWLRSNPSMLAPALRGLARNFASVKG